MTSTIGIPIKLLNEAQVRFSLSSYNVVLSITATATASPGTRTRARMSLAGDYGRS